MYITIYLFYNKDQALAPLRGYVSSTVIPFSSRIVRFCGNKGGEYTYYLEAVIKQEFTATNSPQHTAIPERVGRTFVRRSGA